MGKTQLAPGEVKSGWATSEFWQALLVHIIAAIVALGTVFHTHFNLNGLQAIVPTVALLASAITQSVYSHSRATVKSSAQAAGVQAKALDSGVPNDLVVSSEPAPIIVKLTGIQPVPSGGADGT